MIKARVDVYSHHVAVTKLTPRGKEAMLAYCRTLGLTGRVKDGIRWVWKIVSVFVGVQANREMFRFNVSQLDQVIMYLMNYGIPKSEMEIVTHDAPKPVQCKIKMLPKWTTTDEQWEYVNYVAADGYIKTVNLQTGRGKDLALYSRIKVPGGWKTMGQMQVGDLVTAWDGSICNVTGVHPQGVKPLYRLHFSDGRFVDAGLNHLWKVYYHNTDKGRAWMVVDTAEIIRLKSLITARVYVPLTLGEDIPDVTLPLPPYTLGCLLGDGYIGGKSTISITKPDDFIFERMIAEAHPNVMFKKVGPIRWSVLRAPGIKSNQYENVLRGLDLWGSLSYTKFIPPQYMEASRAQRVALIQGLMDTDGWSEKHGSSWFCSTSLQLAKDVQYLARSLGAVVNIYPRTKFFTYKDEKKQGRPAYYVSIRHKFPEELFSLPRKKERVSNDNQYCPNLKLQIDRVEYVGETETQCITIDHPDALYITDDFIVTHNTHIAMRSAELIGERVLLTMKGGYTKKWREDLKDGYGYGPKEIVIPGSTKDLRVLIALGKQGLITQKFIMISNKLLYGFLKHYESTNGDTTFYGCAPHELCEVLGVGFVIRDEVHQEFHFNFRLDLYTHVKKTLNLSATLISDNPIINTMYKLMMPMLTRFGNGTYNKYIDVIAVQYHMLNERVVRCQNLAFKSYSHVLFEQSIMKNAALTKQYFDFIYEIYAEHYLKDRQPGMKSLVFFATVDMCTCFADYMLRRVDKLVVKRYTQEDDYSNILTAELVVTTLKSAGTAVDIPGLYVAIMTDSINSRQQNEQAVGRLRVMRGPLAHLNPKFIYLYCRTIPKQLEYHLNKREVLRDKVKSLIEVNWDFVLGYFR